jgi:hypothetical protein
LDTPVMQCLHTAFLPHTQVRWLSWEEALVQLTELQAGLAAFLWDVISALKEVPGSLIMDIQTWGFGKSVSQEWMKRACHCKGNNWQGFFVPVIKIQTLIQKLEFWKTSFQYHELDNSG